VNKLDHEAAPKLATVQSGWCLGTGSLLHGTHVY
jgi:hypothetical protein